MLVGIMVGSTGCFKTFYPQVVTEKGVPESEWSNKLLISISEDFMATKWKTDPGTSDKDLGKIDPDGKVALTTQNVIVSKNTSGTVEKIDGNKMWVNFGKPIGEPKQPDIILPMIRTMGDDTEDSHDDVYVLFLNPDMAGDDGQDQVEISYKTIYIVEEGVNLNATYKFYENVKNLKAKGKKPGKK